ncbi:MAG TPA: aldo/keto reductase [bacterium]|jgi:aryl-alcohol dehydrogenase-like predicted oxidoreductase
MQTRKLGNTGLDLTEIGVGAWAMGGQGTAFSWGEQDDRDSIAAIHRALELGINWIDTAAIYGLGHSEEVVGKAIAGRRKDVIIATKCSQVWNEQREVSQSLKAESVKRECEQSLKRLKIDAIDLYQIHWPADEEHLEEGWKAIGDLIAEGKVRYGGVSNFHYDMNHMYRAEKVRHISSLQSAYSLMRRLVEKEALPYGAGHHIGFLAYSPMQAGLLTGKFDPQRMAEDDWRQRSKEHTPPNVAINLDFIEGLRVIAGQYNKTVAQLAIAWVLRRPEVTSAIVGARRPSQIEETAGGSGWKLSQTHLDKIDDLLAERLERVRAAGGYVHPKE